MSITPSFGWLPPTPDKQADNDRYQLRSLGFAAPFTVENVFAYPDYVTHYNQGNVGACTGYSASWMQSIYNWNPYNAYWLYKRGQQTDNDPSTKNDNDGGYIWAVMDVLRKEGHAPKGTTVPVRANGIASYYWCKTIDDIRTAVSLGRPPVFGMAWYSEFMNPRTVNGEFWIGTRQNWGQVLGGHAICCIGASDARQGVKLLNSWGKDYPPVWISYQSIVVLLQMQGECAVALDYDPVPPPASSSSPSRSASPSVSRSASASASASPSPAPVEEIAVSLTMQGKTYSGNVRRV